MLRDTATAILGSLLIPGSQVILPVAAENSTPQFTHFHRQRHSWPGGVKRLLIAVAFGALVSAPVFAQQPGPYHGLSQQAQYQQRMRNVALAGQSQAMMALSVDHRAKVKAVLARLKTGKLTPQGAVQAIDATLTPREAQAVIAVQTRLMLYFMTNPEPRDPAADYGPTQTVSPAPGYSSAPVGQASCGISGVCGGSFPNTAGMAFLYLAEANRQQ
jgi:hypothetical protein